MRIPILLDHFNRGIISQEVLGRVSSDWYLTALQECKNGNISPYGNIRKRPGTKYIANIIGSKFRMIPFVYSSTQAYVLLFVINHNNFVGDNRIYFLTLDGFVVDSDNNPYCIHLPYPSDVDLEKIQYVQKDDVVYFVCKGQPIKKLVRLSENNWWLSDVSIDLKAVLAYGNGTSAIVEGALPPDLIEPSKVELHYKSGGTWYSVADDGNGNFSGTNLVTATIDYNTGKVYIKTARSIPQNLYVWEAGHSYAVGDYTLASNGCIYKCTTGGTSGSAEPTWTSTIDSTVTDNTVTWTCVLVPFDAGQPVYVKFLNQSDFTPGAVTIHQNRLVVGNFPNAPQVFMGSVVGSYEEFVFGTQDNNAYIFAIASKENNEITWMTSSYQLIIGTIGSEYVVSGITPTNIHVSKQSEYGSAFIQPVNLGSEIIFTQAYGTRLYSFVYDYMINGFTGIDLTLLNRDICKAGIKEISAIKQPFTQLVVLLNDGTMALLTYLRSEKIVAWQRYETQGQVVTMATIPAITQSFSKTYAVVNRNGTYYIEAFDCPEYDDYFDTVFTDSAVVYEGDSTNTISVPYPDGTVVSVLTATGVHEDVTVSNGQVVLDWKTTKAVIGFGYDLTLETVPIEVGVKGQVVTLGRPKTLANTQIYLHKSIGGQVGYNNTWWLLFRTANDLMNNLVPLFTGVKKVEVFDSMTVQNQVAVKVVNNQPVPFNLLALSFDLEVGNV